MKPSWLLPHDDLAGPRTGLTLWWWGEGEDATPFHQHRQAVFGGTWRVFFLSGRCNFTLQKCEYSWKSTKRAAG